MPNKVNRKPSFALLSLSKVSSSESVKSPATEQGSDNAPKSVRKAVAPERLEKPEKPDKSGWRKKIHGYGSRPKTPIVVGPPEDEAKRDEPAVYLLQPPERASWRKTVHVNSPDTLVAASIPAQIDEDDDDVLSEHGLEMAVVRPTRPRYHKYFSSYLALNRGQIFSEPWSASKPLPLEPPADPLIALQAVRSHISNFPEQPVSQQHHSGLLRIFEDYRKAREEKDRLTRLLEQTLNGYKTAEESWTASESRYQAEIRRLELIIARGTSGMTGLVRARQGSLIRTRRHTGPADGLRTACEILGREQYDELVNSENQRSSSHRPCSPSGTMVALSKKFSSAISLDNLPVGTPPSPERKMTLSRKVKSELDLARMIHLSGSHAASQSTFSDFSAPGDRLPDETGSDSNAIEITGGSGPRHAAFRELAARAAEEAGIDVGQQDFFLSRLVGLLDSQAQRDACSSAPATDHEEPVIKLSHKGQTVASQSRPSPSTTRRRHFSFEPGDDHLTEENLKTLQTRIGMAPPVARDPRYVDSSSDSLSDEPLEGALEAGVQKPSKIPSPIQVPLLAHTRREESVPSPPFSFGRPPLDDERRRDSRSSILTAFRNASQSSLRPHSNATSRSTSNNNLRELEGQLPKGSPGLLPLRNSIAALAAARAVEKASTSSSSKGNSPSRKSKGHPSTGPLKAQQSHRNGQHASSENDAPQKLSTS